MSCPACGYDGAGGGPVHAYLSVSPACWARYGEVLAREYSDAAWWRAHRVMTDAYCAQHSIGADRRARQSLHIHLAALMLHFEDGADAGAIRSFLGRAAKAGRDFAPLDVPPANRAVGMGAVAAASDATAHGAAVADYGRAVLDAWAPHRPVIRALIEGVGA